MAKFVYSLNTILNVKEKFEDQKRLEYGQAVSQLEKEKEKKKALVSKKDANILLFKKTLIENIEPNEISNINHYTELLKRNIIAQEAVITKAAAFVEQKRVELADAMKERKKYEKLKEKRYEEYLIEEKKEEQKIIDGVVSYKHSNRG
ncbi:MAG: flagellar export protein FliJ [Defluviitaleaceae bacterium]|nr:flagellar export protein FliJ [Defluviitaleaceae bacterium]